MQSKAIFVAGSRVVTLPRVSFAFGGRPTVRAGRWTGVVKVATRSTPASKITYDEELDVSSVKTSNSVPFTREGRSNPNTNATLDPVDVRIPDSKAEESLPVDTLDRQTETRQKLEDLVGSVAIPEQPAPTAPRSWIPDIISNAYDAIPSRAKGLVMLNTLTILMACNWFLVKDVQTQMDPFAFTSMRFVLAALAFAPVFKRIFQQCSPEIRKAGLELGVWSALGYLIQGVALSSTDASRASFLSSFTVILVPIINGLGGRGVSQHTWVGVFIAMVGVVLLEQGGAPPSIGDVWGLLSAAAFAMQMVRTEHHGRRIDKRDSLPLIACAVSTIAACSTVAAGWEHRHDLLSAFDWLADVATGTSPIPIGPLLFTSFFTTDLVLLLELWAMEHVTSIDAALVYSMEPVLGAGMAWMFLGERWGLPGWVGAALIVGSSLVIQLKGDADEKEKAA